MLSSIHGGAQMAAAFLGSSVEAVEAMTIVLAAGIVRGWRSALAGTAAGLLTLAALIAIFGPAIAAVPVELLQIVVGTLLLLFGIRWLRKAILRSAGVVALHDEDAIYAEEIRALGGMRVSARRWDPVAMLTAYKAIVLEGVEVVVIVIGVGAVGNMLVPASIGALVACALVVVAGAVLRLPPVWWALVAVAIGLVVAAELLNTALEAVVDLVTVDDHPLAKRAKDVAAAGVLVAVLTALGIGLSLVRDLAGRHGGRVVVDSTSERGTTMRLELPIIH